MSAKFPRGGGAGPFLARSLLRINTMVPFIEPSYVELSMLISGGGGAIPVEML